jgi:nitrate/nitrite-specific signal transduction histidine kinase
MPASAPSHFEESFETAKKEFFKDLKKPKDYDFSKFTSIDDVYEFTEKLQKEQNSKGKMRHLAKIQPYLQNLDQYVGVLDTFSQVKADLLCLIWVRTITPY